MDDLSWLDKARGYAELGMLDEAWQELESLSPDEAVRPETAEMRITILLDREKHQEAFETASSLCQAHPDNHAGFVQGAYALHALGQTRAAINHLQSGPESLRDEPVYFYNLACYELALDREQPALTWLKRSFEMDKAFRTRALQDEDLTTLHPLIEDLDD